MGDERTPPPTYSDEKKDEGNRIPDQNQEQEVAYTTERSTSTPTPPGTATATNTRAPSFASKSKSRSGSVENIIEGDGHHGDGGGGGQQKEIGSRANSTERSTLRSVIVVTTLTFVMIINTANSTSVSISLPTVARDFNLEPARVQWIISAYPLSSGCLLLVCGRLADVYGRKKMFLAGTLWMSIFTLGCGFSDNVITMEILRGLQGVGGAAALPSAVGILAHSFPPSRIRSFAFAAFTAGAPVGAVFGTAIGGVLTEFTAQKWRSTFWLLSGLMALCALGGFISIDNDMPSQEKDKRVDWIGAFFVTIGLVLIVFVLSQGELAPKKWGTGYIIALLIVGVLFIAIFLYWQHYLEKIQDDPNAPYSVWTPPPLMRLTIWTRANGRFAATLVIAFTNWCAFMAWTFWVQLYYQDYNNYTPIQSVVRLLPMFVSGVLCNVFVGFMSPYVPIVYLFAIGTGSTTLSCLLFAIIKPNSTYWGYAFNSTYLSCVGADFVFSSGTMFLSKFALPHEQSVAGALFNTMVQLGTAMGVTVSTVVFNNVGLNIAPGGDLISKYRAAQWTAFAFGCIATVLCIISFRGVGVVGQRGPPKPNLISENEKGTHLSPSDTQTEVGDNGKSPISASAAAAPRTLKHKNDSLSASTQQIDQSYVTSPSSNSGMAFSSCANTFVQQTPLGSSDTAFLKAKSTGSAIEVEEGKIMTPTRSAIDVSEADEKSNR